MPAWAAIGDALSNAALGYTEGLLAPNIDEIKAARALKLEKEREDIARVRSQTELDKARALYEAKRDDLPSHIEKSWGTYIRIPGTREYELKASKPSQPEKESEALRLLEKYIAGTASPAEEARLRMLHWQLYRPAPESGQMAPPWSYPGGTDPLSGIKKGGSPAPTEAPPAVPSQSSAQPPTKQPPVGTTAPPADATRARPPAGGGRQPVTAEKPPPPTAKTSPPGEITPDPYWLQTYETILKPLPLDEANKRYEILKSTNVKPENLAAYVIAYRKVHGAWPPGLVEAPAPTQEAASPIAKPLPAVAPPPAAAKPPVPGAPSTQLAPGASPEYKRKATGEPVTGEDRAAITRRLYETVDANGQRLIRSPVFTDLPTDEQTKVDDIIFAEKEDKRRREEEAAEWARNREQRAQEDQERERLIKLTGPVTTDQAAITNKLFKEGKIKQRHYALNDPGDQELVNQEIRDPKLRKEHLDALKMARPMMDELAMLENTQYLTRQIIPLLTRANLGLGGKVTNFSNWAWQYVPGYKEGFLARAEKQIDAEGLGPGLDKALQEARATALMEGSDPGIMNTLHYGGGRSRLETLVALLMYSHAMAQKRIGAGTARGITTEDMKEARALFDPSEFFSTPDKMKEKLVALQQTIQRGKERKEAEVRQSHIDPKTGNLIIKKYWQEEGETPAGGTTPAPAESPEERVRRGPQRKKE